MILTINPTFAKRQVSHHGICKTIDSHTADELLAIAIEARKSNNPLLIECFEQLPTLAMLISDKTAVEIAKATVSKPGFTETKKEEPAQNTGTGTTTPPIK